MLRLILINLRNTFILLAIVYLSIPIATSVWSGLEATAFPNGSKRARLPNYKDAPWAVRHFQEYSDLQNGFLSYVGWRVKPYAGSTITINAERIRVTPPIAGSSQEATYFFGGSTMWGMGSKDDGTIPAQYQDLTKTTAVNYGESGWTAHQSLNQFTELSAEGRRPAVVVFYDGVNEVVNKCLSESNFFSHLYEQRMQDALGRKPTDLSYYAQPLLSAAKYVDQKIFGPKDSTFDCASNPKKAALVAEALVSDWAIAKYIAESQGARFFAFLQPVAFLSKTRVSNIGLDHDAGLGKEFEVVYPLIRAKMKERGIGIDLSAVLDHDEYFYIDYCHVSPNANKVIAQSMVNAMNIPD